MRSEHQRLTRLSQVRQVDGRAGQSRRGFDFAAAVAGVRARLGVRATPTHTRAHHVLLPTPRRLAGCGGTASWMVQVDAWWSQPVQTLLLLLSLCKWSMLARGTRRTCMPPRVWCWRPWSGRRSCAGWTLQLMLSLGYIASWTQRTGQCSF